MYSVCVWTCPAQRLMFGVQQEDCSTNAVPGRRNCGRRSLSWCSRPSVEHSRRKCSAERIWHVLQIIWRLVSGHWSIWLTISTTTGDVCGRSLRAQLLTLTNCNEKSQINENNKRILQIGGKKVFCDDDKKLKKNQPITSLHCYTSSAMTRIVTFRGRITHSHGSARVF